MKLSRRMPASMKRTMIRADDHGYVDPPHCNAKSKQTTPGMKRSVPMGSSWFIFSLIVSAEFLGAGTLRIRAMITNVTAPMGRFI
jgi:hypothetical protein